MMGKKRFKKTALGKRKRTFLGWSIFTTTNNRKELLQNPHLELAYSGVFTQSTKNWMVSAT